MWPQDQHHRAPVNDFPPAWASSWGDDEYGIWADLTIRASDYQVSLLNKQKEPAHTRILHTPEVTQKMRWIEPSQEGGFLMGSTQEERNKIKAKGIKEWANKTESNPFRVQVKNGFWFANTPCTQSFWIAVVGSNPSHFQSTNQAFKLPVENVAFQNIDNKKTSVAYFLQLLNSHLQKNIFNESENDHHAKVMLPTEEEWEYACRSDTTTAYWWGNDYDSKKANCNTYDTHEVDLYPPNPWGLYDMHGNVWEWTSSSWEDNSADKNLEADGSMCVVRGGSCLSHSGAARVAYRVGSRITEHFKDYGFRFLIRSST